MPSHRLGTLILILTLALGLAAAPARADDRPQSEWVRRGPGGKLVYKTTPAGDRIMDFSYAGYMGGGVAIPGVAVKRTVKPSGGEDDAAAIQAAIDEVSALPLHKGVRGAVLLAPGVYRCDKAISIAASGVVLRGSGSGPGKKRSTLQLTGKPHPAITVRGGGGREPEATGLQSAITDAYVPSGATSLNVAEGKGFARGDTVVIRRPVTEAWVKFMHMDDMSRNGKPQTWLRPGTVLDTERTIKAVAGNKITFEVPLSDSLDGKYLTPPGVQLIKVTPPPRLYQVGVEQLHIESPPQEISHSQPHFTAIRLQGEDCWLRDLVIDETMNSVSVGGKRITVLRVAINRKAKHQGASKPAEFAPNGTQILVDRCAVNADNVWFIATGGRHAGPIVVLNSTFQGAARAESHQRWSTGMLYDNCRAPEGGIEMRNRGSMGSGHGWSMGWGVVWNSEAKDYIVQNPPGVLNWMIGSIGESKLSARPFGSEPLLAEGVKDSPGKPVAPESLYLAQLAERLGSRALRNIGYASTSLGSARAPVPGGSAVRHASGLPPGTGKGDNLGENLARDRPVTTSNVRGEDRRFAGWQALDDDEQSCWATDDAVTEARLELDTEGALDINALALEEAAGAQGRVRGYRVEGLVAGAWKLLAEGTSIGAHKLHRFARVTVWKVRLHIARSAPGPAIRKFGLYLASTTAAAVPGRVRACASPPGTSIR